MAWEPGKIDIWGHPETVPLEETPLFLQWKGATISGGQCCVAGLSHEVTDSETSENSLQK